MIQTIMELSSDCDRLVNLLVWMAGIMFHLVMIGRGLAVRHISNWAVGVAYGVSVVRVSSSVMFSGY